MNVNSIKNNEMLQTQKQVDHKTQFSKALSNIKKGKPADFDEEMMKTQKTQTVTQVMSDCSTLIIVYDEKGHILSQNKTRAAKTDPNTHLIGTHVENNFGLDELNINSNINFVNLQ